MRKILGLFLLLGFSYSIFAQKSGTPRVVYSGKRVLQVSNMLGKPTGFVCKFPRQYIGTVIRRDFEEDEITVASFLVKDKRDERHSINVNNDQIRILGRSSSRVVSSLLSKGKRIRVWAYECSGGGSGVFIYADRIRAL